MIALIRSPIAWAILAALAVLGAFRWQGHQLQAARTELTQVRTTLAESQAKAKALEARATAAALKATTTQAKGAATNEKQTDTALAGVHAAADSERAGRLWRDPELAAFITRHRDLAQRADTAEQRAATAEHALGVLADLLGRADATAGDLAAFADQLRARLESCARWADLTADTINAGPQGQGLTP